MTFRHTTWAILTPPLVSAYLIACAADPGDAAKTGNGGGTTSPSVAPSSSSSSSAMLTQGYGSSLSTTTTSSLSTPMSRSSSASMSLSGSSSASSSSASSDAGPSVGAGCAAGATVIMMTLSGTNGQSGNFMTTGAVCVQLMGSVHMAWGVSNCQGRSLTITGATTSGPTTLVGNDTASGAIAAGPDGFVYFNFSAGANSFASLYVY